MEKAFKEVSSFFSAIASAATHDLIPSSSSPPSPNQQQTTTIQQNASIIPPPPAPPTTEEDTVHQNERKFLFNALKSASRIVIAAEAEGNLLSVDSHEIGTLIEAILCCLKHGMKQFKGNRLLSASAIIESAAIGSALLSSDQQPPRDLRECTVETIRDQAWIASCITSRVISSTFSAIVHDFTRETHESWAFLNDSDIVELAIGLLSPMDNFSFVQNIQQQQSHQQFHSSPAMGPESNNSSELMQSPSGSMSELPALTQQQQQTTTAITTPSSTGRKQRRKPAKVVVLEGDIITPKTPTQQQKSPKSSPKISSPIQPITIIPVENVAQEQPKQHNQVENQPPAVVVNNATIVDGEAKEVVGETEVISIDQIVQTESKPTESETKLTAEQNSISITEQQKEEEKHEEPKQPENSIAQPISQTATQKKQEWNQPIQQQQQQNPANSIIIQQQEKPKQTTTTTTTTTTLPPITKPVESHPLAIGEDPLQGNTETDEFELVSEEPTAHKSETTTTPTTIAPNKEIYPQDISANLERRIIKIVVRADKLVRFIEVSFSDGRVIRQGNQTKGEERIFYPSENEYVTEVSGRKAERTQILSQITFRTNRGTCFGPMGAQGLQNFEFHAASYQYLWDIEIMKAHVISIGTANIGTIKPIWKTIPGSREPSHKI